MYLIKKKKNLILKVLVQKFYLYIDTISSWKRREFASWILNHFMSSTCDIYEFAAEKYLNLSDDEIDKLLKGMNFDEFIRIDPRNGKTVYDQLIHYESKS